LLIWFVLDADELPYFANNVRFLKLQKGASSARSDDTRSLKSAILDWIVPCGELINPPIARNIKANRGFNHDKTGALLCPAGLDWSDEEYFLFPCLCLLLKPHCQGEAEIVQRRIHRAW
jgi:Family of unknown function (DUF6698)